jgi:hypothetical protein
MIGDAKAKGKSHGAKAFTGKNSKGQSFKINLPSVSDGGGDFEQKPTAKRMDKHTARPGVGSRDKQSAAKQVTRKINPQGSAVDSWCRGERSSYK